MVFQGDEDVYYAPEIVHVDDGLLKDHFIGIITREMEWTPEQGPVDRGAVAQAVACFGLPGIYHPLVE